MKEDIRDFIGVFENAIEDSWCTNIIDFYDTLEKSSPNSILNRQTFENSDPKIKKNDFIFLNRYNSDPIIQNLHSQFLNHLKIIINSYLTKYYSFDLSNISPSHLKLQKTLPGEGYHLWHYENSTFNTTNRHLVYMIYLNDVEEGGETEFLYQHRRVKPKRGTMVLFPPSFTHTHRGNPPLSGAKYAITGWLCLNETKVPQKP